MSSSASAQPQVVAGYALLELIGQGGMGAVFRARAPDGAIVALKLLAPHLTDNQVQRSRFYQEARIAMELTHPNVVKALAVGEDKGQHYLAMEFVDGENLGARVKRDGVIAERDAVLFMIAVAEAMQEAHNKGLVHRDIKPDNILVTRLNQVKLADMGLAKQMDNDLNLTKTGKGLGTPHFMAPEQFRNAKNADPRCDIYSLGATMYNIVTGELPFRGSGPLDAFIKKSKNQYVPPRKVNPKLSERTEKAILRAMDADPNKRPQSCRAFIDLLLGVDPPSATGGVLPQDPPSQSEDGFWYVIATDAIGQSQKFKGPRAAIEKLIRRRRIAETATASMTKTGPYRPIIEFEEFRAILAEMKPVEEAPLPSVYVGPTPLPQSAEDSGLRAMLGQPLLWIGLIGVVVFGLAVLAGFMLAR